MIPETKETIPFHIDKAMDEMLPHTADHTEKITPKTVETIPSTTLRTPLIAGVIQVMNPLMTPWMNPKILTKIPHRNCRRLQILRTVWTISDPTCTTALENAAQMGARVAKNGARKAPN